MANKIVSYGQIAVKLKLLRVNGTNSQDKTKTMA